MKLMNLFYCNLLLVFVITNCNRYEICNNSDFYFSLKDPQNIIIKNKKLYTNSGIYDFNEIYKENNNWIFDIEIKNKKIGILVYDINDNDDWYIRTLYIDSSSKIGVYGWIDISKIEINSICDSLAISNLTKEEYMIKMNFVKNVKTILDK